MVKTEIATEHILAELETHRAAHAGTAHIPPLFVAIQGPQGSGKTFLTGLLQSHLSSPPHSLRLAVLSLDDLYLPHAKLREVANANSGNRLLDGRGQPGTHDVELGVEILNQMKKINELHGSKDTTPSTVNLPIFDKSLHNGQGDRLPIENGTQAEGPLDLVILEGWCTGFCPIPSSELSRKYRQLISPSNTADEADDDVDVDPSPLRGLEDLFDLRAFSEESLLTVNEYLKGYLRLWSLFDVFIQIKPPEDTPLAYIYKWRLQQEHYMKERNGGRGMSDDQVKTFIDRYIPGYVFFASGIENGYEAEAEAEAETKIIESPNSSTNDSSSSNAISWKPSWLGRSLKITIDVDRNVVGMANF